MARRWTNDRFPRHADALNRLAQQHRQLEDEPLHLAMTFGPERDGEGIFLLEVIGNFGTTPSADRELFEVTYGSSSALPLNPDEQLHLILTSPEELRAALRERWESAREVLQAIRNDQFDPLFADETGEELLRQMISEAQGGNTN